jgi:surface antigen
VTARAARRQADLADAAQWRGPTSRYDLVKEFVVALVVMTLLAVILAGLFSSPDEAPTTFGSWARDDPGNFLQTAAAELAGTSDSAQYGQPYNATPDAAQKIGPVSLQRLAGVRYPIDTKQDFVFGPLSTLPPDRALNRAISTYTAASSGQQNAWTSAYSDAVGNVTFHGNVPALPSGDYGPVPAIIDAELAMARSGALDGAMLSNSGTAIYSTDYTKPLLFLADGSALEDRANSQHLLGSQWGMMNETGNYPGQAWLWLYTVWYQIQPFKSSGNADALVWGIMAVLSLAFVLLPFIPGLRSIPRLIPVYRLIWRRHYRTLRPADASSTNDA